MPGSKRPPAKGNDADRLRTLAATITTSRGDLARAEKVGDAAGVEAAITALRRDRREVAKEERRIKRQCDPYNLGLYD